MRLVFVLTCWLLLRFIALLAYVRRRGLLLQTEYRGLSVGRRSISHDREPCKKTAEPIEMSFFGCELGWAQGTMYYNKWGPYAPMGRDDFKGAAHSKV